MEVEFFPQDEEQFKKEAVGNFVVTEVRDLTSNETFTFSRQVTKLWTSPCRTNIVTDHRIKVLKGSHYYIKSWIESSPVEIPSSKEINYWFASSKPSVYDSIQGFTKHSEIDWGNTGHNKINVGDIVYIYITQPEQRIAIKTEVVKSGYSTDELLDGEGQFNRDEEYDDCDDFIRLKLVYFINSNFLGIDELHKHGVNGNIQGKRKVSEQTLAYIQYHEKRSDNSNLISVEELDGELEKAILTSKYSSGKKREERLEQANKYPEQIEIKSRGFRRNADVIVSVLNRANGVCEKCKQQAPFMRKKDNTPYLEVHHKKQLSEGGEDSVENAIAVCPNCHRELHFGV